jgi:hypothetical protein
MNWADSHWHDRSFCVVNNVKEGAVSFVVPLCVFVLGSIVGGVGGIVLGFVWYEHKLGCFPIRMANVRRLFDSNSTTSSGGMIQYLAMGITLSRDASFPGSCRINGGLAVHLFCIG